MEDKERIRRLEEQVEYLRREKNMAVDALGMAVDLGHYSTSLSRLSNVSPLLRDTVDKVRTLIRFKAVCIYLVNEDDADFYPAFCDVPEMEDFFQGETARLIENKTFSWTLQHDKAMSVTLDSGEELLLHRISTASRTRGMLVGVLEQDKQEIMDIAYGLLSIVLFSCANSIESYELYKYTSGINAELKKHVTRLAESERELLRHRQRLEEEVAARTQDLTRERDFTAAVLETAGALVLVLDRKGRIVRFNRACEQASGYSAAEVMGSLPWNLLVPKEKREEVHAVFQDLVHGNYPNTFEGYWVARDGGRRHISWTNTVLLDGAGTVEFIIATGMDNTEQKSAEAALRDSEARFRAVFMMAGIGIVLHDSDGILLDCNPMFLRLLGYSRAELFSLRYDDILHPEDVPGKKDAHAQLFEGTHVTLTMEKRFIRKDGQMRLGRTTMTMVRNHLQRPQYYIDMVEDITESRQMQDALRQAERTYRNIFENAVEGIFITDAQGAVIKANPAMVRMLGHGGSEQQEAARDEPMHLVIADPKVRDRFMGFLQEKGSATNYEMQILRRDRRKVWVSVSAWTALTADGEIERIEGLIEDITDRKLSELSLQLRATTDELTGVANRYLFMERLEQMLTHAERTGESFAVLYLDLDDFKLVNDQHGHRVGDMLLEEAATRMRSRVRQSDTAARIGGDEFTLLLANIQSRANVEIVARDIVETLGKPYLLEGRQCVVSVSLGISIYPEHGATSEDLLQCADKAMYAAKEAGGGKYCFADAFCKTK